MCLCGAVGESAVRLCERVCVDDGYGYGYRYGYRARGAPVLRRVRKLRVREEKNQENPSPRLTGTKLVWAEAAESLDGAWWCGRARGGWWLGMAQAAVHASFSAHAVEETRWRFALGVLVVITPDRALVGSIAAGRARVGRQRRRL